MTRMITDLGDRIRLRVRFLSDVHRDDPEHGAPRSDGIAPDPLVDFVAYGEDCILSARVALAADRLTDLLNTRDAYELRDVVMHRLDGTGSAEVLEVSVPRDEILAVEASGPRGSSERRLRTRGQPVAMRVGPYQVTGRLHGAVGVDPMSALRRRAPMVPLTDAVLEFLIGGEAQRFHVGALVVNRDHVEWVTTATEDDLRAFDRPWMVDLPEPASR
jgi:hypothetical protein